MELRNGVPVFQKKVIDKQYFDNYYNEEMSFLLEETPESMRFLEIINLQYNHEIKLSMEMILALKQYKEQSKSYLLDLQNIFIGEDLIELVIKKVKNEIELIDEILKGVYKNGDKHGE